MGEKDRVHDVLPACPQRGQQNVGNVDNSVTIDTSAMRRMFAMYMFCADTYLAPIYSECFEDVDDLSLTSRRPTLRSGVRSCWPTRAACSSSSTSITSAIAPRVPVRGLTV